VGAEKENGRRRKSSTTSSKEVEKEKVGDTGEKLKDVERIKSWRIYIETKEEEGPGDERIYK
jgi:hypothetical protein